MPRAKRYQFSGAAQLLYQRGHNGGAIFTRESDYKTYLNGLYESAINVGCSIHAYSLVPNEIYVLCTPNQAGGVSRMMQAVGTKYAYHFNNNHGRTGTLCDGRYKSCVVEPGRYLLACYRFVDVRAAQAFPAERKQWSSYPFHALGASDVIIDDHWVYRMLSTTPAGRQRAYSQLVNIALSASVESEISRALQHNLVLGSDSFKDEIAERGHDRVRMGKPGRPRKTPSAAALRLSYQTTRSVGTQVS